MWTPTKITSGIFGANKKAFHLIDTFSYARQAGEKSVYDLLSFQVIITLTLQRLYFLDEPFMDERDENYFEILAVLYAPDPSMNFTAKSFCSVPDPSSWTPDYHIASHKATFFTFI